MLQASLNGKISSRLTESEDILTSNVFSFFKYTFRARYLKSLLDLQSIHPTDEELKNAEFRFWPRYDDSTEPDVVITVGDYYLLFEAKHLSDFGTETETRKGQIDREIVGGMNEAKSLGKTFLFVAITSHYNFPAEVLAPYSRNWGNSVRWMNWQAVAKILLEALESDSTIPDQHFVSDLYNLLEKMKLRPFLPFQRLPGKILSPPDIIFFSARTAYFRGDFIGFEKALSDGSTVPAPPHWLFYRREYFKNLTYFADNAEKFHLGDANR